MKDFRLYLILDRKLCGGRDLISIAEEAIAGGVDMIQLRDKESSSGDMLDAARRLRDLTKKEKVNFVINDRIDVALATDADGVHLGDGDLPIELVRGLLGKSKIIGATVRNLNQAKEAQIKGADYVSVGAIFPTETKEDAPVTGFGKIREISDSVNIPVVAIGGININNINDVVNAGARRIAVARAILGREDIKEAAGELKLRL